jgi:hypothetical protein
MPALKRPYLYACTKSGRKGCAQPVGSLLSVAGIGGEASPPILAMRNADNRRSLLIT